MKKGHYIYLLLFGCFFFQGFAQKIERINLQQANKLKGGVFNGEKINKVLGNVIFTHDGATMYCDSAYQYVKSNKIDAFGHVRILDKGTTVYGDVLYYNGDTELAKIRGKEVRLVDDKQTLTTQFLDYNLKTSTGIYFNGGKVVDEASTLTSERGTYFNLLNKYTFKKKVKLVRENYTLHSDTLEYHTVTKMAFFHGPTNIYSATQHLFAKKGQYHTVNEISRFKDSAFVETDEFKLTGDSLYFNNTTEISKAFKNVKLTSVKDTITIYGDQATRWGKLGYAKVYGNAVALKKLEKDTLYLLADTLINQEDTLGKKSGITAFNNVKLFHKDFQGKSDSLIYLLTDSTISMFKDPVLWNKNNQITGDTVISLLKNGEINRAYLNTNSFVISHDTLTRFNQIKGRNMIAYFKKGDLDYVDVLGNGESIYYAVDDADKSLTGLNYIICSNMVIYFKENQLNQISFLKNPDAKFIPPAQITNTDRHLKNFNWQNEIKPQLYEFISRTDFEKIIIIENQ